VLITELKIFQIFKLIWKKLGSKTDVPSYSKIPYNNIDVNYVWRLNGGGILLTYEFAHIVSQKIGKVHHAFEYCAGPGFIGFNLLANGLCDKLTLSDINPDAIKAIRQTIEDNNLQDKVSVYESDCLMDIPEHEQWDLVVGNPPWDLRTNNKKNIRVCDISQRAHKLFFRDIKKFLKPNGSILFVEGHEYSKISSFKNMIENNGLEVIDYIKPVPFFKIFSDIKEYKGLRAALVIFLRLGLCFREIYFFRSKRKIS